MWLSFRITLLGLAVFSEIEITIRWWDTNVRGDGGPVSKTLYISSACGGVDCVVSFVLTFFSSVSMPGRIPVASDVDLNSVRLGAPSPFVLQYDLADTGMRVRQDATWISTKYEAVLPLARIVELPRLCACRAQEIKSPVPRGSSHTPS